MAVSLEDTWLSLLGPTLRPDIVLYSSSSFKSGFLSSEEWAGQPSGVTFPTFGSFHDMVGLLTGHSGH